MSMTNYHLTIKNNNEEVYFYYKGIIHTGDLMRIDGYRVIIIDASYDLRCSNNELEAMLVNEFEIVISRAAIR